MSEYYLVKEIDQSNKRKIHRDDCGELPSTPAFDAGLKYLGSFGSKQAAYSEARGYFGDVDFCPNCLKQ